MSMTGILVLIKMIFFYLFNSHLAILLAVKSERGTRTSIHFFCSSLFSLRLAPRHPHVTKEKFAFSLCYTAKREDKNYYRNNYIDL
jgi:hypothetical protein